MLGSIKENNLPPFSLPELYRPLDKAVIEALETFELDINNIVTQNPDMKKQLANILQKHAITIGDAHYFALKSRYLNIVIVFDANRERVGYLSAPLKAHKK